MGLGIEPVARLNAMVRDRQGCLLCRLSRKFRYIDQTIVIATTRPGCSKLPLSSTARLKIM